MIVYIEDRELEYANEIEVIDDLIEDIHKILKDESKILDYLEIDGEKIYTDFGKYIFNNIADIEEITVGSSTIIELMEDTLLTTLDYIENSNPLLENLRRDFSFSVMPDLIEALTWIFETFIYMDKDKNLSSKIVKKEEWNIYAKDVYGLGELLPELLSAMEKRDEEGLKELLGKIIIIFKNMETSILELLRID